MRNHYSKILFPVTLYHTNIRENNVIQREILSLIQSSCEENDLSAPEGWLTDKLITSYGQHELNHKIFESKIIHDLYYKHISAVFDKPVSFSLSDIWFNCYVDGEYQEIHDHLSETALDPQVNFSCIHYLKYDEKEHISTTFHDPIKKLRHYSFEMDSNRYSERWTPRVREGDLLIFPSYLEHHVNKSEPTPNNPRITIAFNLRILSYGDKKQDKV